jgi:hypothetical protein
VSSSLISAESLDQLQTGGPFAEDRWGVWRVLAWVGMVSIWITDGVSHAHKINTDGVSYLDMASDCLKGNWAALVNGYWSPAYPLLLAIWLRVFRPSAYWEGMTVRCLNCLILVATLLCFEYFLNGVINLSTTRPEMIPLPRTTRRVVGYTLFCWITIVGAAPSSDTPDAIVLAAVLLTAGLLLRIEAGKSNWIHFLALGTVLGVGYLAKSAMFPLAFVFLAATFLAMRSSGTPIARLIVSIVVFILISAPFVSALSKKQGHFTFGDSGAINYAEYVNGAPHSIHWSGEPPGTGVPLHPTRLLTQIPPVYEYARPIGGSYPPWTDPSYWYAGIRPRFKIGDQVAALRSSLVFFFGLFRSLASLFAGFIVLLLWSDLAVFAEILLARAFLWGPAIIAFGMYALVWTEVRYISGFIILLWAAAFSALQFSPSASTRAVLRCVTLMIVLILGLQIVGFIGQSLANVSFDRSAPDWQVSNALIADGIRPGDKVSFIGDAILYHYWAHLSDVSIVSEVSGEGTPMFWTAEPGVREKTVALLARTGAKAIVARDVPWLRRSDGWKRVSNTSYYILLPGK